MDAAKEEASPAVPRKSGAPLAAVRTTGRSLAKASRRAAMLDAAAALFAERGYNGVSIEELGAAAGVSGPAVYRHFSGKPAVLSALLVGVSEDLLDGGKAVVAESATAETALRGLIEFQVDFALRQADVIRVQDRDLNSLPETDERAVRSLQRQYVEVWVDALSALHPGTGLPLLRQRAQAVFGLINSTSHTLNRRMGPREMSRLRSLLETMAWAALKA
ncbi:TetR/AcrR family transcriptional regulator [Arthrobacter sp. zg-ZUI100]|uniref:TetR/AcrR family transcriptional regulator n=1 Tax=Arthrobacter jiangjiafuii TaxID=2817475 RepID=A0A975R0L8_9MICC|nr:TetR/AcrR family transcriptional regulator [Arthrobacter jiangjiafuii]MBP3037034.1 TetR/AcrR family transcriptional regulator [Arthrobacter jiangjiafuii]MBP3044076.1 TetR/AcrR family transcriptional regulator [Arthrobacter jiangjiafuii]QWC11060.1 TetR/AcrR family transcriptional regulator [Arthrobacter jiangjiafuii]